MKLDLVASKDYQPTAIYYEDSDSLEYLRVSSPAIYRRIDTILTLILSMEDRSLVGFKLKGFKNFYIRNLKNRFGSNCPDFIELVDVLQEVTRTLGEQVFEEKQKNAYHSALEMAAKDRVHVRDFPKIAS
ncbi:hypothetical protein Rleg4DRAFT_0566 [Rhizobium leguminosarum bv. trifolii WSM2297]|uniref:Uncharacterized protein n=1 Tax=Rhizobium leguminosarum bv. trifolii WSM2297 TaxID=754762 RepID=J0CHP3_RHILT|nr:hypothetical protein [Rhizobium leguminosarum]EJC78985.1 hypothetical protein Rleg4DRAFT_0566 [Rhizobium leguminosarum bv. trifolii WSM2297]